MNWKHLIMITLLSYPNLSHAGGVRLGKPDWLQLPTPHENIQISVKELRGCDKNGRQITLVEFANGKLTTLAMMDEIAHYIPEHQIEDGYYTNLLAVVLETSSTDETTPYIIRQPSKAEITSKIIKVNGMIHINHGKVIHEGMND